MSHGTKETSGASQVRNPNRPSQVGRQDRGLPSDLDQVADSEHIGTSEAHLGWANFSDLSRGNEVRCAI